MKNDLGLREKIGALNTLSGGIVFGREEAWERLQGRLDKKQGKTIAMRYWMAAAAVLLLFITVATVYNFPPKQVARNNESWPLTIPVNPPVPAQVFPQPVAEKSRHAVDRKILPAITTIKPGVEKQMKIETAGIINKGQMVQESVKNVPENILPVNNTVPEKMVMKQMKAIHINELADVPARPVMAPASVANVKQNSQGKQVLHINDIDEEEWQAQAIKYAAPRHDNIAISFPFLNAAERQTTYGSSIENYTPHNTLKIKIN